MPSFRSINLELRSQFDIDTFPEYYPPTPKSEEGGNNCSKGIAALKAVDDDASTCNVYIPAFPGSHFWINYSISPPIPDVTAYFLFKMYIDGTHVVSWSCGKEDNWSGKTVFVLHEKADSSSDKKRIEKRFFCFSTLDKMGGKRKKNAVNGYDSSNFVEITVHRARGRKRIPRQLEQADKPPKQTPGISLVNAGRSKGNEPKRFYKFALIDAIDQPFATFCYHYRTWEQLEELGVFDEGSDFSETSSLLFDTYLNRKGSIGGKMAVRDGLKPEGTNRAASRSEDSDATPTSSSPRPHDLPTGTTKSDTEGNKEVIEGKGAQHSVTLSAKKLKRLSIPPSVQLAPSVQTPWTASLTPRKSNGSFSFEYKPHPAYQMEDWAERTPTPIRSVREGLSTPPLIKRVPGLVSAVTNALKKRSENGGSAEEVRSMSIEGCVKS